MGFHHLSAPTRLSERMFERKAPHDLIDLQTLPTHGSPSLDHVSHPVQAYLNGMAPSSRRPQLSALDWIARRSTQVFTAETMPWQRLRRAHVLKIRGLLEEHYQPATRENAKAARLNGFAYIGPRSRAVIR